MHKYIYQQSNDSTSRYLFAQEKWKFRPTKDLFSDVHSYHFIQNNWEGPKCPSPGKQKNKLLYLHSIEYYSAEKKELKIRLSLKSVMLGEGTRTLKKYIGMNDFM